MTMNRFENQNSAERIYGYFVQRPNETVEAAFDRAKEETLKHMRNALDQTASMTFEDYVKERFPREGKNKKIVPE